MAPVRRGVRLLAVTRVLLFAISPKEWPAGSSLGLIPGAAGTQRLPRVVGAGRPHGVVVIGKPISALRHVRAWLTDCW